MKALNLTSLHPHFIYIFTTFLLCCLFQKDPDRFTKLSMHVLILSPAACSIKYLRPSIPIVFNSSLDPAALSLLFIIPTRSPHDQHCLLASLIFRQILLPPQPLA